MNINSELLDSILFQVTKPARYTGGEWNAIIKDWDPTKIKIALAFPDTYEIGMSNLAIPILYQILNNQPDVLAERVYAPWVDMEEKLRKHHIPLYSLETKHPLGHFDIIGFSLGYELGYTNVLNMLDMAYIPVLSKERDNSHPLVIAGGSCVLNPEPMSDFIDLFIVGEAEEAILNFLEIFRRHKKNKERLLIESASLPGIYIPGLYHVEYDSDGIIKKLSSESSQAKQIIRRQIFASGPGPVTKPVIPFIEVVHDRGAIEIQRGCTRGCRFCQAGMIYRPVREISHEQVLDSISQIIKNCGYNEISLVSLSSGDYHDINGLIKKINNKFSDANISLSLPSLRLDKSSIDLIESLPQKRKTTLTFAPEAGSERLRKAINKNIPEDVILETFTSAFSKGWLNLKLYFMIGLPTETMEDIEAIVQLINKILKLGTKNRRPALRINVSTFIPKPHTPCQWYPQEADSIIITKQEVLRKGLRKHGVRLSWQDTKTSQLEAVLARGDRRLAKVIYQAWKSGCRFDSWHEHFKYDRWLKAFENNHLYPEFYANRDRKFDEILPWHHIDTGISTPFFQQEYLNLLEGKETGDCRRESCNICGLQRFSAHCREKMKLTDTTGCE